MQIPPVKDLLLKRGDIITFEDSLALNGILELGEHIQGPDSTGLRGVIEPCIEGAKGSI